MDLGVIKETHPDEHRIALVPAHVPKIVSSGHRVLFEPGSGEAAGYPDEQYIEKGAVPTARAAVFAAAEVLFTVRGGAGNPDGFSAEAAALKPGSVVIGMLDPYAPHPIFETYRAGNITSFALELIPRITRAQSMDVLSSMANLAGYKAVLIAASELRKMFPMMMTAAGTVVPAKVFVLGAGVAGLQAIATAKRLGAVVSAYDVRPAAKDQVLSLGAKFAEMPLDTGESEDSGGYAKAMDEEFYRRQREFLTGLLAETDAVITTAAIPGKKSPVLITEAMVKAMQPGAVIVDLAAERGGNCEISEAGKTVVKHGVTIAAPLDAVSSLAYHASQLYSKNITTFFFNLFDDRNELSLDRNDEIIDATLITRAGGVPNAERRTLFGLA